MDFLEEIIRFLKNKLPDDFSDDYRKILEICWKEAESKKDIHKSKGRGASWKDKKIISQENTRGNLQKMVFPELRKKLVEVFPGTRKNDFYQNCIIQTIQTLIEEDNKNNDQIEQYDNKNNDQTKSSLKDDIQIDELSQFKKFVNYKCQFTHFIGIPNKRNAWGNVDRKRLGNYCFSCGGFVKAANYESGFG
ncbi:hypothetical protein MEO94_27965 [Dolichospermum sp. ST_sed9]|jgi:hypothetical protein|nr:hypothetical protein [Dolichospermum sp. ST_sed9]